ncbi:hypothetical protein MFLAVUS_006320 [Mucor flavus]|uniref:Uncharacterized protein n=1 Tax=Mucor flavus TaxID=439312 RepID=A0ABP9Z173_9FUNG
MGSKSLPSSFKQKNSYSNISIQERGSDIVLNSSSLSSSVKKSSPLAKSSWCNEDSTISHKSWLNRRWSTISGSLMMRQRNKKTAASRNWINRQKRRTFPPSSDILRLEQKRYFKRQRNQQSLADILTAFYSSSESSSVSKRIGKILKKKGKQPYRKKARLHVDTQQQQQQQHYTEQQIKSAVMAMFQPPPTISSKSSSPSTPIKFPTPPKRFSAVFIDSTGKHGKVNYIEPSKSKSKQLLHYFQHGVTQKLPTAAITTIPEEDAHSYRLDSKYNQTRLEATLFLFGFIFFPFWWIGVWVHHRRPVQNHYYNDLFSVRTFSYLNTIFTFISILLIIVILSLIIWLVKA